MPTDTKQMKYSKKWHMYILDVQYLKSELGLDFVAKEGSLLRAKDKLYQVSRVLHNFVYNHARMPKIVEYSFAFDEELRPILQEALEWQARYEYESNAIKFSQQLGVNVLNGITINSYDIRGWRVISPQAEDILRNNNLLYIGRYSNYVQDDELDYEELGY